jgi:hypothetical protein
MTKPCKSYGKRSFWGIIVSGIPERIKCAIGQDRPASCIKTSLMVEYYKKPGFRTVGRSYYIHGKRCGNVKITV